MSPSSEKFLKHCQGKRRGKYGFSSCGRGLGRRRGGGEALREEDGAVGKVEAVRRGREAYGSFRRGLARPDHQGALWVLESRVVSLTHHIHNRILGKGNRGRYCNVEIIVGVIEV